MSINTDVAIFARLFAIDTDSPFREKPTTDRHRRKIAHALTGILNEPPLK